ncbi:hypothetical protein FQZ97_934570 [compost metagenome]
MYAVADIGRQGEVHPRQHLQPLRGDLQGGADEVPGRAAIVGIQAEGRTPIVLAAIQLLVSGHIEQARVRQLGGPCA